MHEIHDRISDPKKVAEDLESFRRTTERFSADYSDMLERYPNQWIALYSEKVRAQGNSLEAVLTQIDEIGLPRGQTLIEYMDPDPQLMLL